MRHTSIQDRLASFLQTIDVEHVAEVGVLRVQLDHANRREQELLRRLTAAHAMAANLQAKLGAALAGRPLPSEEVTKNVTEEPKRADEEQAAGLKNDDLQALADVCEQRHRQIRQGHDQEHDDSHKDESLVEAALYYANLAKQGCRLVLHWPWSDGHPTLQEGDERGLIHAAALLLAEIARRRRAAR